MVMCMVEHNPLPMRLLVIDDDDDLRHFLQDLLTEEGYVVDSGGTLDEALALIDAHAYHLILTDLLTHSIADPLRSALVVKRRAYPTPVVALTGWNIMASEATRAGLARLIAKPFDLAELLTAITACLTQALSAEQQRQAVVVARLFETFNAQEIDACAALFTDDVRIYAPEGLPLEHDTQCENGQAAIRARLEHALRLTPGVRLTERALFPQPEGLALRCMKSWPAPETPDGDATLAIGLDLQFSGGRISQISVSGDSQRWRGLIPESAFLTIAQERQS